MIDKHKKYAACQIKQDDVNEMIYHIMNLKLHENRFTESSNMFYYFI